MPAGGQEVVRGDQQQRQLRAAHQQRQTLRRRRLHPLEAAGSSGGDEPCGDITKASCDRLCYETKQQVQQCTLMGMRRRVAAAGGGG